ncbi:hypothetical protein SAMN05421866_0022 [Chryseobacterium oranimense]|uniref:Uncharacterized protein n=1 Tax=Chryseobacterium oranimense TaxID=421058 RepID=A0A1M5X791_9FLAO|nr:hypothetical protein [Chryseobacterium oranimense]SHH95695.1 hypothetical protein SAMN05421866_0022 [Chryseobacterium oranimense]
MKTSINNKPNVVKLNNESFSALKEIELIKDKDGIFDEFGTGLIHLTSVLDHYNWGFNDSKELPNFHSLGLSMVKLYYEGSIGKYQKFCIIKLSSILYDARLLYENNLINFTQLKDIVSRVKKDAYKRFKSIEKSHAKNQLINHKLDGDSLLLLHAKLAIIENEN